MQLIKIIVFVPLDFADELRIKIGDAGFGKIGNYSHCVFISSGSGYFKPDDNSNPSIGEKNKINTVDEMKLEFVCYENEVQNAINLIKKYHPYEEVAMDIIPLLNHHYDT